MGSKVLQKAIKGRKQVTYTKKPALIGRVCDSCGKVYQMGRWCNDTLDPGIMRCTFEDVVGGNTASFEVCSFACAHKIYTGGWKNTEQGKEYAAMEGKIARVELGITSQFKTEQDLRKEWKERGEDHTIFVSQC